MSAGLLAPKVSVQLCSQAKLGAIKAPRMPRSPAEVESVTPNYHRGLRRPRRAHLGLGLGFGLGLGLF